MTVTQLLQILNAGTNLHASMDNDTLYLEGKQFLTVDTHCVMFWQHTTTAITPTGLVAIAKFAAQFDTTGKTYNRL